MTELERLKAMANDDGTWDLSPNDVAAIRCAVREIEGRASDRNGHLIYVASPYSHADARVREQRFDAACRAAAALMRDGQRVFSPVAHSAPIARYGLPTDWAFWEEFPRKKWSMSPKKAAYRLS